MRALAGLSVLIFFGLLGAAFVAGLAGLKGNDPRKAAGYYLGIFAFVSILASVMGLIGSVAGLMTAASRPPDEKAQIEERVPPRDEGRERGRIASPEDARAVERRYPSSGLRRSGALGAALGVLASLVVGAGGVWLLYVGSNMAETSFLTGKPKATGVAGARGDPGGSDAIIGTGVSRGPGSGPASETSESSGMPPPPR